MQHFNDGLCLNRTQTSSDMSAALVLPPITTIHHNHDLHVDNDGAHGDDIDNDSTESVWQLPPNRCISVINYWDSRLLAHETSVELYYNRTYIAKGDHSTRVGSESLHRVWSPNGRYCLYERHRQSDLREIAYWIICIHDVDHDAARTAAHNRIKRLTNHNDDAKMNTHMTNEGSLICNDTIDDGVGHVIAATPRHRAMANGLSVCHVIANDEQYFDDTKTVTSVIGSGGDNERNFDDQRIEEPVWLHQLTYTNLFDGGFLEVEWQMSDPSTLLIHEGCRQGYKPTKRLVVLPSRDHDRSWWIRALRTATQRLLADVLIDIVFEYFDT
jgi:hypothetical protein